MNLQNIPRQDKTIKRALLPKLDAFLFFDYMQIELRLLAFYMASIGDTSMADAIKAGKDLHTESAMAALGRSELTDEQRQVGKTLNFSIVYGGGRPTIMRQLDLTWGAAGQILDGYHRRWPGINTLNAVIAQKVAERGYVKTLWGRHLHPESQHKALNALVQGCAADLMKSALIKVHRWLRDSLCASHLVLTIHDELVIDAMENEIELLALNVPELMSYAPVDEVVPIGVDTEISRASWADKEAYERHERLAA